MILPIVKYGDPILRRKSNLVKEFGTQEILELINNMKDTMLNAKGVGIAAPQVGVGKKIFLADASVTDDSMGLLIVVNPVITVLDSEELVQDEGCLSIPGLYAQVKRPKTIKLEAFNEIGEPFELGASEYLARIILHEYDHLEGVLFTDKVLVAEKKMVEAHLNKMRNPDA